MRPGRSVWFLRSPTFLLVMVAGSFNICLSQEHFKEDVISVLKDQVIERAELALKEEPLTVTAFPAPRSAGGRHDFYSEGDYWWPDPSRPDGPYVQRDGQTNPDNFVAHRHAMIRLSEIIGALGSAYIVTKDEKYVRHAFRHAKAWFVDTATMMNPSLLYAQAIKGRTTGRGIGIIDTIHLIEVVQGLSIMQNPTSANRQLMSAIKEWFSEYLDWLTSHQYGIDEMNARNNHGTCWVMQVSAFAKFTDNKKLTEFCKQRYKTVLLPNQMASNGSFPEELRRTKPYGYSIFNLDAMVMVCKILSDEKENLWRFEAEDGKQIVKAIEFLFPYIKDKNQWTFGKDVMYWENWPVAQPFLVFGAQEFNNKLWFDTWKALDHEPKAAEVIRNLPIRNPIIWLH